MNANDLEDLRPPQSTTLFTSSKYGILQQSNVNLIKSTKDQVPFWSDDGCKVLAKSQSRIALFMALRTQQVLTQRRDAIFNSTRKKTPILYGMPLGPVPDI